jgi:hypothetical protein
MEKKLLTKTEVKNKYFLTDTELDTIQCIEKNNPYRKSLSMYLYDNNDILNFLKEKFSIFDEDILNNRIDEMRRAKEYKKRNRVNKREIQMETRKKELKEILDKHGLTIRSDSKLCNGYIDGTIKDKSLEWIAHRMCQMKYLFEYCNFNQAYQEALDNGYHHDLFDEAEQIAISKVGGYPFIFPWLTKPNPQ